MQSYKLLTSDTIMKTDSKHKRRRRRRKRRSLKNLKKTIPIVNNHSKRQDYFLLLKLFFLFPMITAVSSLNASAVQLSSPCMALKMNYSFDFAFNQIVSINSDENVYHHYLYSQKQFLKLHFDRNSRLQVIPFRFERQNEYIDNDDDYAPDFGFGLHSYSPLRSKFCAAKIHHKHLTCIDVEYRGHSAYIGNKETFLFDLPKDFRPSLAFQHIGYDHYKSSRFQVILVEQTVKLQLLNKSNDTNKINRHFERRWQVYSFEKLDRITNLTYSALTPDYLDNIPDNFEITGIFGWIRKKTNSDEYMVIVFNGTDHLYCLNEQCANVNNYKTFMEECKAPIAAINQKSMSSKLFVTKCCGQWTEFKNSDDDEENEWQLRDGKLYRVRSVRYTNLKYVIWSLILLLALILLLVICWIYSCITETRYERKMEKIISADHRRNYKANNKQEQPSSSAGQSLKLSNISKNANKFDNDEEHGIEKSFFVKDDNAEHNKDNENTSNLITKNE